MPVTVIDKIKQKNGSFKLMDAADVEMESGKSVEEAMSEIGFSVPVFDLGEMGLPAVSIGGEASTIETDTTEIIAALEKGAATFIIPIAEGEESAESANITIMMNPMKSPDGDYQCVAFMAEVILMVMVTDGTIWAGMFLAADAFGGKNAVPVSVDLSKYESEGIVVETYADGSTLTHNFEFDDDGKPVKITDSDGNVQTITW